MTERPGEDSERVELGRPQHSDENPNLPNDPGNEGQSRPWTVTDVVPRHQGQHFESSEHGELTLTLPVVR